MLSNILNRPFPRLVSHFTSVIVNTGQDSGASDLNLGIGGLLAILAVPGAFVSLLLFDKYSSLLQWLRRGPPLDPYTASIPDKYFFVVYSMVVTGVIATLKWDRIFPGRQDYVNLAPLPFPSRNIFFANLLAIVLLACIFAVDVNAASALMFPMVVLAGSSQGNYLAFVAAHAATMALASGFTFFACFAIVGALLSLVPGRALHRVSLLARLVLMAALLALLFTSFSAPAEVVRLHRHPHSWVRWLPPVWFLALYQQLQGRASGELAVLAGVAIKASGAVFGLAMALGVISYRRHFQLIPESATLIPVSRRNVSRLFTPLLDRIWLRDPVERACYRFGLRALLRSETHCILFGAFAALGLIAATQSITGAPAHTGVPPASLLAVPLCLIYFVTAGVRLALELPAGLRSNWVFQLVVDRSGVRAASVAGKLMLTFVLPIAILPCLLGSWWWWGAGIALPHTGVALALTWLLLEIMLARYRKIPFACAAPGFQNHALLLVLIYVLGYFLFTSLGSHVEHWMLLRPIRLLALPPLGALAWYALRRINYERGDPDANIVYDAPLPVTVQKLNILG